MFQVDSSPHGPMALHKNDDYGFSIQFPTSWQEKALDPALGITGYYVWPQGAEFVVVEEDLAAFELEDVTLDEYVEIVLEVVSSAFAGFELISEMRTTTSQGLDAVFLKISGLGGSIRGKGLIHLNEYGVGFNVTYLALKEQFEELESVIDYSLGIFRIEE